MKELKIEDLKLNHLNKVDMICDLIEELQRDLFEGYIVVNRNDIIGLLNNLESEEDPYDYVK